MRETFEDADVLVAMPAFNSEATIEETIQSVLLQTYQNVILSVVDDASTDGTPEILRQFADDPRVILQRNETNRGPTYSRNKAANAGTTYFLAFIDADDLYAPDFIAKAMETFQEKPLCDIVKIGVEPDRDIAEPFRRSLENTIHMNRVMKRAVFDFIGGFPESGNFSTPFAGDDAVLNVIAQHFFNMYEVTDRLYRYRIHPNSHFLRFMERAEIVDGKVVFADGMSDHDRRIKSELDQLLALCKQKSRLLILNHFEHD